MITNEYLQPLWQAFERYAELPAVVDKDGRVTTYRELGQLTRHIACGLVRRQLPDHSFIPILLPTSMEYIAAEMGVWMAGHAVVPMGTTFPEGRIEYIKEHCEAPLVIDEQMLREIKDERLKMKDEENEISSLDDNALLIYTSGSTGEPKGILHTFDSLYYHAHKGLDEDHTDMVWGTSAPFYFVAGMSNFPVLKGGGQLHFYTGDVLFDVKKLEDYIEQHGITHTFISPAVLANFHNRSASLKVVYTGSEKVVNQCSRDGYVLLNNYGMTETMGTVFVYKVDKPYETTPVGRPAPGSPTEWMLLGDDGKPVAEGEDGELVVKGHFCKGYYKDPERTAQLYHDGWLHTNDIMRQLPDGNMVYVNRKDWMVKINGQRVEPGEVENAIKRIEGVRQAIVKGFDGKTGSQYLCGYYTAVDGSAITPEQVHDTLAAQLPPYMVPLHIVKVDEFSLLPNGKVNRKALLPPDTSELQSNYVAPTNDVERALCDAFAEVFGMEQAGIDDDFFMLGGDSVKVMRLQQTCESLNLTSKMVYKGKTPRHIAELCAATFNFDLLTLNYPVPLSQTQMGIYAESMARQGEAAYNNPILLQIDTTIDEQRLAKAIEHVVEAHSFIKTHIGEDAEGNPVMTPDDTPYQQTIEQMSEAELEALKPQLIQPFNLRQDQLFRIRIIRTDQNLYLFSDFHHIIYDGTSMRIFMNDVDKAYAGEAPEPERWTGYHVAQEEAALRQTDSYTEAKAWYEETFGALDLDSKPIPDVPEGQPVAFATQDLPLGVSTQAINNYCRRQGITANILTLAAFGKMLGAYSNLHEALFATIYNGRSSVRTIRTIDMMVKTLPVYCRWTEDMRISDFLQAVKQQLLGAMNNDIYSFAELATVTGINSDVLFAYQGDYLTLGTVCGHPYHVIPLEKNATGSSLNVQVFNTPDGPSIHVEYQQNQYSDAFVSELMQCYANIVRAMLTVERMSEIELVSKAQLDVLNSFNQTEQPYDTTQTVVSLFKKAADRYPDNTAIIYQDVTMTYREVDELTDRLASHIQSKGLGRGDVVSILIPRGEWMILASMGALKASCGYQPLDSTYPEERLNFMVKDAASKLLITTEQLRPKVSEYVGEVWQTADIEKLADQQQIQQEVQPQSSDLFTLLYTSGSTGVPKGVRLTHANLVCFIDWYHRFYDLQPHHVVGAYASYGFDANMMDMYPALASGAAVCIIPEDIRLDMEILNQYLEQHGVTHQFMTTQVGRLFAADVDNHSLKYLIMGGEKLIPYPVPSGFKTYNGYGPTECTILSTIYEVVPGESNIPIGKMLDNMKGYIVSLDGKRLPIGAIGELWIAGPHVGDGYLNRPEKTAEVFIQNPFDGGDYKPLYRSGDIVRYKQDGNIEFIGRRDGQVKIRGFRVELSEVETVVREYPDIKDATVAAFDHPSGGKYIAAYVVSDKQVDPMALADFIRERKPPYMVPAAIMQLERIPLNQNDKVNKRALPKPEVMAMEETDNSRPLNILEQELQNIAAKVIGIDSFGVTTPLIHLGLTSILSIKLATQLFKRFGVEIQSKVLLSGASIETLENMILGQWMEGVNAQESSGIKHQDSGFFATPHSQRENSQLSSSPLSFPQTGVYYECMKRPTEVVYNIPALLRFSKNMDADKLEAAVRAIVDAHPVLNSHFEIQGDNVMQVRNEDTEITINRVSMSEDELDTYKREFVHPFHLATGPLCRFAIVTTEKSVCLLTDFHHLSFDGSSMDIFIHQLSNILDGSKDRSVALQSLVEKESFTYFDFAADEKRFEASPDFENNRQYYADMLADFENASELTADLKGKEVEGRMQTVASPLDMKEVNRYAQQQSVTPAALLLAATFYTIARYTADQHVYLSTISSGRSDVRIAETFGMFVNTLPLGITISDQTVAAFVKQSADVFSGVIEHEKYPFARIAAEYGYAPQIVYEYQLGVIGKLSMKELEGIESLEQDTAKFKLSIHIEMNQGLPSVVLYYNDALYSRELIAGMARSIVIATEQLCSAPEGALVKNIALIDDERARQLKYFRSVATAEPRYHYFFDGSERFAAEHPDRKALIACDAEYTYAEFKTATDRIAAALQARGVKPRSRVALLLPRTSRVILSMFGVMKAGSAYIPCDPEYPRERVQHILSDSHAAYIITTAERLQDFDNAIDVETLLHDAVPGNAIAADITPQDLAYLIYTSGSTGKPKGVMLRHESIANYLTDHPANSHIHALATEAHTLLSVTTVSFDMSLKEIGAALFNGLTLVLANEEQTTNPMMLADLFKQTKADAFNATPSRMLQYMELPAFQEAIAPCKVLMCGGEKYADGLLDKLRKAAPGAHIFNTYGPTEITVSSNAKELTHTDQISIGRPLLNVTEFIVDKDGNELPQGVVGELYIGGMGVASGYNDLPEMTAERFIDYSPAYGDGSVTDKIRIYKSGDYARWTEEGDVVVLGRTDNQIKLRGLRIELGEVEAALAAVEGMKNVVVKIGKIKGMEHLCAYFTADHEVDIPQLKEELGRTLTRYMVPTAYLQLEKMPLTPNGKTDVKSLPEPELATGGAYEAPANDTEQALADIFAKVLSVERVGANDSFFDLGGTSLVVTRVIIETNKAGLKVAYGDVFANPTPRRLSNFILGISEGDKKSDELSDFDYTAIDNLLQFNTLANFRAGERQPLGNVLLTGATGYLGIHILRELIDSDARQIYCLVRGKTKEEAESRLRSLLYYYFANAFKDLFGQRIHVILGDVTQDLSAIMPQTSDINTVFNCAAIVKHFSEGTEIEDVNIGGAQRCVDFCIKTGARLIHVSTASTRGLWTGEIKTDLFSEQRLYMGQFLGNKYVYSKFMAERLILDAVALHGLNAKIMRVGNLAARSTDGEFQANFSTNTFLGRIKVYNMLGCCPHEMRDSQVEFSPINEVSKAIVLLSTTPKECTVFHPYNNHSVLLGDVLSELKRVGSGVQFVELSEFSAALKQAGEDPQKAKQLSSMLAYQNMAGGQKAADVGRLNTYTMQVLYRLGFHWSSTSWDYIDQFLGTISGFGFFEE